MQDREIREAITGHLRSGGRDFGPETDLFDADVIDSMGVLELVAFIDDELGVALDQDDLVIENFRSVERIVRTVSGAGG